MTTNTFLEQLVNRLEIPNFLGVFMKDTLPKSPNNLKECGIMNFDTADKPGSHWVCWIIDKTDPVHRKHVNYYFDSYGTAVPDELRQNIKSSNDSKIYRSDFMIQQLDSDICGELCMAVLYCMMNTTRSYKDIVLSIRS